MAASGDGAGDRETLARLTLTGNLGHADESVGNRGAERNWTL
ncbi:MAG: hypothetical protein R3D27_05000 [Hyphomicrobiaceae bacterium]